MMFVLGLLSKAASLLATGLGLLLAWAVYYQFSTTKMPPGICQPLKIRILHIFLTMAFGLGHILWKIGICSEFAFIRIITDGLPSKKDEKLSIKNTYFEDVPVRIYHPKISSPEKRKGILFFHGGTGVIGSIDAYENMCSYLAWKSDVVVVSVGQHLAPEYRYPMQFCECFTATEFFMKNAEHYGVNPTDIVIIGDNLGGTLAAFVSQELVKRKDLPKLRAQILVGPFLQALDFNLLSYQQNRFVPIVSQEFLVNYLLRYITKNKTVVDFAIEETHIPEDRKKKYHKWLNSDNIPMKVKQRGKYTELQPPTNPFDNIQCLMKAVAETTLSPLLAEDAVLQQQPDTFILTCEFDVLRDDGLLYRKRLEDNGVRVSWCHLKDGFYGVLLHFNRWFLNFTFAQRGVDSVANYINSL
ncbi:arylacetamide deacetylase-like 4 [Elgaria multicarinata webbii]|uniref:arylacetamide deacetylase-like 4 n=1 Tax=Elgaria multicarinata webbii TaxID=159646 RepID=UPI002FCD1A12